MPRNVFRKFYSLKSYRFATKLILIVKNAFSVLDFYSLFFILYSLFFILYFVSVAFLFLLFLSCSSLGFFGVCV
ncbi:hypothetical protein HPHPH11_1722 [Helicobacter pylori Hp H-11]|nr:hypothetical protein HPHPH11_1722 [Helicobacter pylori Hp H-11]